MLKWGVVFVDIDRDNKQGKTVQKNAMASDVQEKKSMTLRQECTEIWWQLLYVVHVAHLTPERQNYRWAFL